MVYGCLIAAWVCLALAVIFQENKIYKLQKKFNIMTEKHNDLIDTILSNNDDLVCVLNERIAEINEEFGDIYDILRASKKFADDATDTLELMCDTDEMIIDRINDIEDEMDEMEEEITFINVAIDDLDSIIYEMFEEEPEEVEEKKTKKK